MMMKKTINIKGKVNVATIGERKLSCGIILQ